jgi:hypothetical protein
MPSARAVFLDLSTVTVLVVALSWAPLFVEIAVDRSCAEDEIPAPALLRLKGVYGAAPWVLAPGILTLVLLGAFRALPRLKERKTSHKVLVLGGAAATQAVIVVILMMLSLTLDPHWLFGIARPTVSKPSPDGARTAWAARGCFLKCSWHLYVQEQGAWKLKRLSVTPAGEPEVEPTLEWSADSKDVTLLAP